MRVHRPQSLRLGASVVSIGAFDSVHRGHQVLIRRMVGSARRLDAPAVVYTFDPPPRSYFQNAPVLTPLAQKLDRLTSLGVDEAIVARFDAAYAARGPQELIEEIVELNPFEVWVGRDFRFGEDRKGDVSTLRRYFEVRPVEPICSGNGKVISSSLVRNLVSGADLEEARLLLGWGIRTRKGSV